MLCAVSKPSINLPVQQSIVEGNPAGQLSFPQYKPSLHWFLSSQSPSSISQRFAALQHPHRSYTFGREQDASGEEKQQRQYNICITYAYSINTAIHIDIHNAGGTDFIKGRIGKNF